MANFYNNRKFTVYYIAKTYNCLVPLSDTTSYIIKSLSASKSFGEKLQINAVICLFEEQGAKQTSIHCKISFFLHINIQYKGR